MLQMVIGAVLALIFLGLPLATIGLFIMSVLDRRNKRTVADPGESKPIDSDVLLRRAGSEPDEGARRVELVGRRAAAR
jgi:hypothetical protein